MATFILKHTTNAEPVTATGRLEFNTDKNTLVVGDGTNEVVIAKMNVENQGSFLLTGDIKLSGSIYLGDVAADNIAALGTFTTNLVPNTNNSIDVGSTTRYWRNVYATSITGAIAATNGVISGSSQIAGILPAGTVSGSSQIVYSNISGISANIVSSSTDTANVDITITNGIISAELRGNVVSSSAQIIDVISSLNLYTGSNDTRWTTLAGVTSSLISFTGSQEVTNSIYNSYTQSTDGRLNNLESTTASLNTSISNINLFTGSVESRFSTLGTYTSSVEGRFSTLATLTGSIQTEQNNQNNRLTALEISSGAVNLYTQSLKDAIDVTGGNTTIKGNLIVAGTTTAVQSTTLNVADKNIVIASGSLSSAASDGAGITIDGAGVLMSWSDSNQRIELNKPFAILGAISASTIAGLNGASVLDYSTSVDSRFVTLNGRTNLLEIASGALNQFTQSVDNRFSDLATYTGSINTRLTEIGVVTGSLIASASSAAISIVNLNLNSASLNTFISNLNQFSGSQLTQNSNLASYTGSVETRLTEIGVVSGSLINSASSFEGRFSTLGTYTGSVDTRLIEIGIVTGSLIISASAAKNTNDAQNTSITNLNLFSASVTSSLVSIYQTTASLNLFSASVTSSLVSIYQTTASLNAYTASALVSMSAIFTSASAHDGRLDYLEGFAFGGLDISGQFTAIGVVTGSLITSASLVSQSVWHLHQFSSSVTSSLVSIYQTTSSLNAFTESADQRLDSIESQSGSWVTEAESGSFLITASYAGSTLTFTKGNNQSFNIEISTGSAVSASLAQNALDVIVNVKNTTGAQLNKGTIVRIIGSTGDNPLIQTASWENDNNSANTLGWLVENIANDEFGRVITQGTLLGINTTGMTAGQMLYLSSSGQFTNIKPIAPYHEVRIGQVLRQQQNNGSVFVSIMNGYELEELHDVDINSGTLLNNNLVAWNSSALQWVNKTVTEVGAVTSASFQTYTASADIRLNNLEQYSGSLKTAIGVSGANVTILGDLIVNGTTTTVNSTTVQLGDNIIELNGTGAANGGLKVKDPTGGSTVSGSLLWDSTNDYWKAGTLANESKILLAGGDSIISASAQVNIYDLENFSTFNDAIAADINAREPIASATHTLVSGSSQISYGGLSNIPSGIVSGSSQITGITNGQLVNSTITIAGTSTSLGGTITLATITGGSGIISGSGQLANYETTGRGLVSGSAQIIPLLPNGVVSGSTQLTTLLPTGTVSGSSQVTYNSITGIPAGIVSGAAQVTSLLPSGVISGSSQLTTEFDTRYLNTGGDGVFSSSVQIGNYVATITGTTNQITVAGSGVNAAGITLSIPQNIHTSATPQFGSLGIGTAASGVTGEIRATGDIVAYYSSDERLKENINPIADALEKVEAISGNTYDWKEGFENIHSHKGNDVGVIAQEVEKILPQAVLNRDNGYKAVDYEKIVPLLIEAIKELSQKVKDLEKK